MRLDAGDETVGERERADLQIGEVAERTGVTQRTLRFYEEKGLLNPPTRMDGGFRLYSEADVRRVQQIRRLQNLLGMPLAEIKEMVQAEEALDQIRAEYRPDAEVEQKMDQLQRAIAVTEQQRAIILHKIEQLQAMNDQLEQRLNQYHTWEANLTARREAPAPSR
jgi:MerR family transcriptional regulator, repressor of the yfmOP operon